MCSAMFAELANYVAPKRKAVEMSSDDETRQETVIAIRLIRPDPTSEQGDRDLTQLNAPGTGAS
jgi:hypothetical protein